MNLTKYANNFGSDKGTTAGSYPHKYTYIYDLIFYPLKDQRINLLEMGLAIGGPEVGGRVDRHVTSPSVQMWIEYFPLATIYGFDISDFSHMEHPRFRFIRGDSGSLDDIGRLAASATHFDVIIDDASHASYHQQLALRHLWPKLASGGLYIIEDLQWQSPVFEVSLPPVPKTHVLLSQFFEKNLYQDGNVLHADFMSKMAEEVFSFSMFSAINGQISTPKQIILRKR